MAQKRTSTTTPPADGGDDYRPGDPMDVKRLERLVRLMDERGLTSLELQDGDKRISLARGTLTHHVPAVPAAPPPPSAPATPTPAQAPAAETRPDADLKEIASPMVGTFYASPKPGSPAFVAEGSRVTGQSDVCIIEAMKVFNTIKAEVDGTIDRVLVADGAAVEFGQPLFLVRPS